MNIRNYFVCIGLLAISICYSQQVIYDFDTKIFSSTTTIESGGMVQLIVVNVNPFIYEIEHEKSVKLKNPLPANLFSLLVGDFATALGSFKTEELGDLEGIPFAEETTPCIEKKFVTDLIKAYEIFLNEYDAYSKLMLTVKNPNLTYYDLDKALKIISSERTLGASYSELKKSYGELVNRLKTEKCQKNDKLSLITPVITPILTPAFETKINSLEILSQNAIRLLEDSKEDKKLKVLVSKFIAKGDELKVSITIKPREVIKSFEIPVQVYKDNKTFKLYKTFSVSFNPGLIFTSGVKDNTYNVRPEAINDTITIYSIIKEKESKINYGISALTNFTWSYKKSDFGLNIGFGFLPKDSKITGLIGGTIIFGEDKKFLLNGGIAAGFVKTLSDALSESERYLAAPEIKTKDKLTTGLWFGLGYRL